MVDFLARLRNALRSSKWANVSHVSYGVVQLHSFFQTTQHSIVPVSGWPARRQAWCRSLSVVVCQAPRLLGYLLRGLGRFWKVGGGLAAEWVFWQGSVLAGGRRRVAWPRRWLTCAGYSWVTGFADFVQLLSQNPASVFFRPTSV